MKNYLIAIIAIIGFVALIQGASADDGADINLTCPPVYMSIDLTSNDQSAEPGTQIDPVIPQCLNVTKCAAAVAQECTLMGGSAMCQYNAAGTDVGMATGTHCLNPSHEAVLCTFTPTSCTVMGNGCDYNAAGIWVGNNQGGYEYDEADGYKMGLKAVTVSITINAPGGIDHVCKSGAHGQGIVKMVVDNYDIQKGLSPRTAIVLNDPAECTDNPNVESAVWTGTIYMHYWEKPGMYTVHAEAISCCGTTATDEETFQYMETAALCMAPPGKRITYGNAQSCVDTNSTAMGDVRMSTCDQCDIGSAPATIRNIGNAVVNTKVAATDLVCTTPSTCNGMKIPVTKLVDGLQVQGNVWIDLGNGWKQLWNTNQLENLAHQSYCSKNVSTCCNSSIEDVYGLPPGPHATNVLNLMIKPLPCLQPGSYGQTIYISSSAITGCCQDHRESAYPSVTTCITPPQAYEVPGRYAWGTPTQG